MDIIAVTTDSIPGCNVKRVFGVIQLFIENYSGNNIINYSINKLCNKAVKRGANAIVGLKIISSSTYFNDDDRLTPDIIIYGTALLVEQIDSNIQIDW